jgi:hypothetical protein
MFLNFNGITKFWNRFLMDNAMVLNFHFNDGNAAINVASKSDGS